jgi:hypothetical protein
MLVLITNLFPEGTLYSYLKKKKILNEDEAIQILI